MANVLLPGDPIGLFKRINPNGFDWSQPTSAARPVWARFPRGGIRNLLSNNMMVGAVEGSPGTLPTTWTISGTGTGALTRTVVGTGTTDDGRAYIDIRFSGTTSTTDFGVSCVGNTQVTAAAGEVWTSEWGVALVGGTLTNVTDVSVRTRARTADGTFISDGTTSISGLDSAIQYVSSTYTMPATSGRAGSLVAVNFPSGVDVDFTLRLVQPQLEKSATATAPQQVYALWDVTEPGQPSVYLPYYSGSQWMDSGTESFGNASLFADAGQEWTTISLFRTLSDGVEAILGRQSTNDAIGTFSVYKGTRAGGFGRLLVRCRGLNTGVVATGDVGDGRLHIAICRWNSSAGDVWVDGASPVPLNVGTAAEETGQTIISGGRANGANALYDGHLANFLIDRALTNSEIDQVRAWAANTYGVQM